MSISYVEDLTLRYFKKKGYLTIPNIQFQLDKERIGTKVSGWSDIDLLAIDHKEIVVIQCKSFIGTKKAELISADIITWFDNAIHYLKKDEMWSIG